MIRQCCRRCARNTGCRSATFSPSRNIPAATVRISTA
ncbi:MAG: hypothetical protein KDH84_24125, partial [Calditrichaeota bacterium]|nr:hypothetical protein [Calditrichota bacterium]